MGATQAILSSVFTIFFYAIVIAAVWKLFQIGTELVEIKTILSDIRKSAGNPLARPASLAPAASPVPASVPPPVLAGPISLESAEALLREVAAESHALEANETPRITA